MIDVYSDVNTNKQERVMSEINWNLAPEGTDTIKCCGGVLRFFDTSRGHMHYWWCGASEEWRQVQDFETECVTIAVKPTAQTKTVADAYEYYGSKFPFEEDSILGIAYSNEKIIPYYKGSPIAEGEAAIGRYIICTREQFEAYAKKQEAEQWTHVDGITKCKMIYQYQDMAWVKYEGGENYVVRNDCLKPIKPKPKLTKKEYELMARMAAYFCIRDSEFDEYMSKFDSKLTI